MTTRPVEFPLTMRVKASLYALVLVASAAFAVSDRKSEYPAAWLAAATAGAVIAWLLVEYPLQVRIPKLLINSALVVAAGFLCFEVIRDVANDSIILSLGHFIIALMLCKLFEYKTPRDMVQIIILTLLVVVAGAMFSSSSLFYAILLGVYLALLIYVVQLLHLFAQADMTAVGPRLPAILWATGGLEWLKRDLRRITWQSLWLLAPVALVVFLIIPRSNSVGFFGALGAGMVQTGFSEDGVQFRDHGQLVPSDAVVMQVKISKNGENIGSEFFEPYFRGRVFEEYRIRRRLGKESYEWVPKPPPAPPASTTASATVWATAPAAPPLANYSVINGVAALGGPSPRSSQDKFIQEYTILAPVGRSTLFVLAPPASVWSDQFDSIVFGRDTMTVGFEGVAAPNHYTVYSYSSIDPHNPEAPATIEPGLLAPADAIGRTAIYVSPQINELAHHLAGLPPDRAVTPDQISTVVADIESYLKANYPYSLSLERIKPELDPTTDFLLNRKETGGHCEDFASAMVMLCRAVGINAREVAGFHGGEYNSIGGYYIVRQRDAHVWAEIYVPESGWVTYDPSPIRSATNDTPIFLSRWAHEIGQITQNIWLATVVSFDNDSRRAAFAWLAAEISMLWDFRGANIGLRVSFLIAGFLVLAVARAVVRRRRRAIIGPSSNGRGSALVRNAHKSSGEIAFLDELLRLVGRKSVRRFDLTPREFVDSILAGGLATSSSVVHDARWLVDTAYGLRFGSLVPTPDLRTQIASSMRRVRSSIRESSPVKTARK